MTRLQASRTGHLRTEGSAGNSHRRWSSHSRHACVTDPDEFDHLQRVEERLLTGSSTSVDGRFGASVLSAASRNRRQSAL